MQTIPNLKHLFLINSIDWRNGVGRVASFFNDYYFGQGRSASLVNITLELTHKCNQSCQMCHYGVINSARKQTKEMDLKTLEKVISEAARLRAGFFLTGGEPLLRPDLIDIIKSIKAHGLKCGLNTNGTLLDKNKIIDLAKLKLDYIIFSIHGSEKVHDKIVGADGAYKKTVDNLKFFSENRMQTRIFINQVITRESFSTLRETVMLAKGKAIAGVRFQHLSYLSPENIKDFSRVRSFIPKEYLFELSCKEYEQYAFPVAAAAREMKEVIKLAKENKVNVLFKPMLDEEGMANWYGGKFSSAKKCIYPWGALRIAPNGDVFGCPILLLTLGNVKEESLGELLNNQRFRFFRRLLKNENGQFSICARCCKLYMSPFGRIKT